MKNILLIFVFAALLVGGALFLYRFTSQNTTTSPAVTNTETSGTSLPSPSPTLSVPPRAAPSKTISSASIPRHANAYRFSAVIPSEWEIDAVPETEALNIYDPAAPGPSNLEKSQIFIRYFRANDFLTLSTVTILSREKSVIVGRPAETYVIEKKSGVANFANQPLWRSARHRVTDIRVSDTNPSYFYVIAKRPDLSDKIFEEFLNSIQLESQRVNLVSPIQGFERRISKKPFGIFVTPENSPVQPEHFRGYHTGVYVENDNPAGSDGIPIYAIAPGTVILSKIASGYGGVVAIQHIVGGDNILGIYGHLKPSSLPAAGARIGNGEQIGALGDGFTSETGGERQHLHFGLYRGEDTNIKGYVRTKEELKAWYNPVEFFARFGEYE